MSESELKIAKKISQRIKMKDPFAIVWLFGSHGRGAAHEDSDWNSKYATIPFYENVQHEGIKLN